MMRAAISVLMTLPKTLLIRGTALPSAGQVAFALLNDCLRLEIAMESTQDYAYGQVYINVHPDSRFS
jgi:hypothetical protein